MGARETDTWKWLKKEAKRFPDLDISRVENIAARATADIDGCNDGVGFWMEQKVLKDIRKDGSGGRLRFEHGQREWLQRRWAAKGQAFALIEGHQQALYLIPGCFCPALPLEGVVETQRLEFLSVLHPLYDCARGEPHAAEKLFLVLRASKLCRETADRIMRIEPGLARLSASPVQAMMADMGIG